MIFYKVARMIITNSIEFKVIEFSSAGIAVISLPTASGIKLVRIVCMKKVRGWKEYVREDCFEYCSYIAGE